MIWDIFAADLDGDGDLDVLSAIYFGDTISWHKNTDGQGTFASGTDITTSANGAMSVFAADLDGDGGLDVLSAAFIGDTVSWYNNTDGRGTFSSGTDITTSVDGAISVFAADLDGDGDLDVLSAAYIGGTVSWYENTDGQGTFSSGTDITNSALRANSVLAADLDGDGDLDVLAASYGDGKVTWYENTDGRGTFSSGTDIADVGAFKGYRYGYVAAADLDGDGDLDVLTTSYRYGMITWYENTDGRGTFSNGTDITDSAGTPAYPVAADLDGDGDLDVLCPTERGNTITWYENTDGRASFSSSGTDFATSGYYTRAVATDLDGDGDVDILALACDEDEEVSSITWFENLRTSAPTPTPTDAPTSALAEAPTSAPTAAPTAAPTSAPTAVPTATPASVSAANSGVPCGDDDGGGAGGDSVAHKGRGPAAADPVTSRLRGAWPGPRPVEVEVPPSGDVAAGSPPAADSGTGDSDGGVE